jgi:hypothetical protein
VSKGKLLRSGNAGQHRRDYIGSTTHQGRADGDFADAGGNLLATVSYPDGNPTVNVAQFAHDAISPFVNVG